MATKVIHKARTENGVIYTPTALAKLAAQKLQEVEYLCDRSHTRSVWDPCCGDGALLEACQTLDNKAYLWGIDTDAIAIGKAKEKGYGRVAVGDLFDYPPPKHLRKVICNPPYVGRSNIRRIVGEERFEWLKKTYACERSASCDLAAYVLRHILQVWRPAISCWIVTNTIAQGASRRIGLRWALASGYKLVTTLKDIPWPGDSVVTVHVIVLVDLGQIAWKGGC